MRLKFSFKSVEFIEYKIYSIYIYTIRRYKKGQARWCEREREREGKKERKKERKRERESE